MYSLTRSLNLSYSSLSLSGLRSNFNKRTASLSQVGNVRRSFSIGVFPIVSKVGLISTIVRRGVSYFCIHPEKLKQLIKEKDAQTLCNFFASKDYQKRISEIMEQQKRMISENPIGITERNVKYEHVLNCAQPIHKRRLTIEEMDKEEEPVITLLDKSKRTKPIKTTIMSVMLRKKRNEEIVSISNKRQESTILPIVMEARKKNIEMKKKFRKRTTILPIFLKKMQQKMEKEKQNDEEVLNDYFKSAKKIRSKKHATETADGTSEKENIKNYDSISDENLNINEKDTTAGNLATKGRNNTSATRHLSRYPNHKIAKKISTASIEEDNEIEEEEKGYPNTTAPIIQVAKYPNERKKMKKHGVWNTIRKWRPVRSKNKKREKLSKSCELNLPAENQYELDNSLIDVLDLNHVGKRNMSTCNEQKHEDDDTSLIIDDVFTLFDIVKLGSVNNAVHRIDEQKYLSRDVVNLMQPCSSKAPSVTYQIVSDDKRRRKAALKEQFQLNRNIWKRNPFFKTKFSFEHDDDVPAVSGDRKVVEGRVAL